MVVGCGNSRQAQAAHLIHLHQTAQLRQMDSGEGKISQSVRSRSFRSQQETRINEAEAQGFQEAIEAAGATCIVSYPETATADAQITVLQSLISQGVDSISVAANDENALQATLQQAMDAGITYHVLTPRQMLTAVRYLLTRLIQT